MSIIYDALKKVQKSNNLRLEVVKETKSFKPKIKQHLFYLIVVCLGIFIGNIFFGFLSHPKSSIVKQAKPSVQEVAPVPEQKASLETEPPISSNTIEEPKEPLVLNGIFFSEDKGYALINNKIVKEGDTIGGATVKRITSDNVELEKEGSVSRLTTNQ